MKKYPFCFLLIILSSLMVSAQTQKAQKFEEFNFINCDEWEFKLSILGNEISNSPNAKAYIIYYGSQYYPAHINGKFRNVMSRRGEAKAIVDYYLGLLFRNHFPKDKLIVIEGGYQEKFKVEFWLVPEGTKIPELNPTVKPGNIKFRKGIVFKKQLDEGCTF